MSTYINEKQSLSDENKKTTPLGLLPQEWCLNLTFLIFQYDKKMNMLFLDTFQFEFMLPKIYILLTGAPTSSESIFKKCIQWFLWAVRFLYHTVICCHLKQNWWFTRLQVLCGLTDKFHHHSELFWITSLTWLLICTYSVFKDCFSFFQKEILP